MMISEFSGQRIPMEETILKMSDYSIVVIMYFSKGFYKKKTFTCWHDALKVDIFLLFFLHLSRFLFMRSQWIIFSFYQEKNVPLQIVYSTYASFYSPLYAVMVTGHVCKYLPISSPFAQYSQIWNLSQMGFLNQWYHAANDCHY